MPRGMYREHLSDFMFLLETKNSIDHDKKFQGSLGYDHQFSVNSVGLGGGLTLFWRKSHEVEIICVNNRSLMQR